MGTQRTHYRRVFDALAVASVLLTLIGCSERTPKREVASTEVSEFPTMALDELKQRLGEPVAEKDLEQSESKAYTFSNGQICESQGDRVVLCYRMPQDFGRDLQYWRNLWRSVEQNYDLQGKAMRLIAPGIQQGVIYDPALGHVIRVVSYGKPLK